jgi:hypothetical protein
MWSGNYWIGGFRHNRSATDLYFAIVELKKMGIKWGNASYIYRLHESLWFFKCDIPVVLGNNYCENWRVRAQLFWLQILLLEGRHVSAPLLGHHQVTKNILRGNYGGGRVGWGHGLDWCRSGQGQLADSYESGTVIKIYI